MVEIVPSSTTLLFIPARQTLDHLLRHWHCFHTSARRMALHPHTRLETLDREHRVLGEAVAHVKARSAEFGRRGLDGDVVAEPGRNEEAATRVDQRMPGEIIGLEIVALGHAERALDERRGAGVEKRKVTRVIDDA